MFTLKDYVGVHWNSPDWNEVRIANAQNLMAACKALQERMEADGVVFHINPKTGTTISGEVYGGFRPQDCPIGAPESSHKQGKAVDRYDPYNQIDDWLLAHPEALAEFGIFIEHPDKTPHWSHWAIKTLPSDPPHSGHHIFYP